MAEVKPELDPYLTQYDGLSDGWVSSSFLQDVQLCGLHAKYRYIDRISEPLGPAGIRGTGLHTGRETNLSQKIVSHEDLKESEVVDAAVASVDTQFTEHEVIPEPDQSKKALQGRVTDEVVAMATVDYTENQRRIQPIEVEQRYMAKSPRMLRTIVGKIDTVIENRIVVDLKSRSSKPTPTWAAYNEQLTTYGMLYRARHGEHPTGFRVDVVRNLKRGSVTESLETNRSTAQYNAQLAKFEALERMVDAGIFLPAPADSWKCSARYCGYWMWCPFGQEAHK